MRARDRVAELEQELHQARADMQNLDPVALDEATATRLLGEEAARILQTARESGALTRAKAEEGAAQLLKAAEEETGRLRQEADLEISRRRHEATIGIDAELGQSKQQGREMVEEARAYRERVIGELGKRRELARQQTDQLMRSRDRLLQAFERARLVASDVITEVAPLEPTSDDLELSPTTGPATAVGAWGPDASAVDVHALPGERAAASATGMYDREEERADDVPLQVPQSAPDPSDPASTPADVDDDAGVEELPDADAGEADAADSGESADESEETAESAGAGATVVPFPGAATGPTAAPAAVGDLFARLRAESAAADVPDVRAELDAPGDAVEGRTGELPPPVAMTQTPAPGPVATEPEATGEPGAADRGEPSTEGLVETPFTVREASLVPLIVAAARKLKRVLADEQNEVLDALRRNAAVRALDDVVADEEVQAGRYADAVADELSGAASAAAASIAEGAPPSNAGDTGAATNAARSALAAALVTPLRQRIARCVDEGDGDNDEITRRVRAVYREWKTQRIDEQLDGLFRAVYARAAFEAIPPGSRVGWIVDPAGPESPDCEDNSLAGIVAVGGTFPTGHAYPPAHPGCRCLLIEADG